MTIKEIPYIRLINQQILNGTFKKPKDLVSCMGAMQAQDFAMSKWALGIRLKESTLTNIDNALNKGEILRTHLLRPTWHLVSASDIYWILELTAPHIKATMKSRLKELELDQTIINKSYSIIERIVANGNHLTREEIIVFLNKAKIPTNDQRAAHIMASAELDQLVCSGIPKGKKTTYALLEERVPKKKIVKREEALGELAKKYFNSHAPATLADFIWWSGLSSADAKKAIASVQKHFVSHKIEETIYFFPDNIKLRSNRKESIQLLPAFDEFLISYKNREASLLQKDQAHTISNNGIFRPVIVENGLVVGLWSRIVKKEKVIITTQFFKQLSKSNQLLLKKAGESFAEFLGVTADLK